MKHDRFYTHMDPEFGARVKARMVVAPTPREPFPTMWPLVLSLSFCGGMLLALLT